MKYTEKDLYKGMKLRCTDDGLYDFWKKRELFIQLKKTHTVV